VPKKKQARLKQIKLKELAAILGRASRNPGFKRKLLGSPAKTLKESGLQPHAQAVAVIRSLKHKSFGAAPRKRRKRRDSLGGKVAEA
jgi:hypothetical protein